MRNNEGVRASSTELELVNKQSTSPALNEANSRITSVHESTEIRTTTVINLNDFIQTARQSTGDEGSQIRIFQ